MQAAAGARTAWPAGGQGQDSRPRAVSVTAAAGSWPQELLYLVPPAPGVLRSGCRCGPCGTKYNSSCGWEPTASFMTARNEAKSQLCARGRFPSRLLAVRAERHGSRGAAQPFLPRAWLTYPPQPPVCQFAARSAAQSPEGRCCKAGSLAAVVGQDDGKCGLAGTVLADGQ